MDEPQFVVDRDGDMWERDYDGSYFCGTERIRKQSLSTLLKDYGPLDVYAHVCTIEKEGE